MAVSFVTGQYGHGPTSDNVTLPAAPTQNNLLLDFCGHFTNAISCQGDGYTSYFEQFASEWDIGSGYKYAGAGESATQSPGSVGISRVHFLAEFTGVTGTIGTDVPTQHHGVDQTVTANSYSTVSFNTAANNTGIYGLVGASCSASSFSAASLSGGSSPVLLETFSYSGSRFTIQALFYDSFAVSGTSVQYTLALTGGSGTIKGFYGLLSIANFASPSIATSSLLTLLGVG